MLLAAAGAAVATAPVAATVPARNGLIAYQDLPRTGGYHIYTVEPDGTGTQLVTGGVTPAFSPDGNRLAVGNASNGIRLVRLDGTPIRTVVANGRTPAWAPTGDRIAFTREYQDLWTVEPDGSGATRVLDFDTGTYEPAWSPDGRRIAFAHYGTDQLFHLYTVRPDGTGLRQITRGYDDGDPSWSPDGSRIVFKRNPAANGNSDLWTVRPDGTGARQVTRTSLSNGREVDPSWSPNGQRIAFYDFARSALFTIAPDGSGRSLVRATMANGAGAPDWQAR